MTAMASETSAALDLSVLLGDWRNTNAAGSISRIVCEPAGQADDGRMTVHCYGRCLPETRDWGVAEAPVFAFTFEGKEAGAFSARYDFGFEEVRMQANVKAGVLVVATFNSFRDQSGRSNYFDREFFYRTKR
ncbi:MAG: hypothetical protein JWN02_133 [Acidobacteria bacterium]|nr:hypothetical protein [Acidobacteriota bacterium]